MNISKQNILKEYKILDSRRKLDWPWQLAAKLPELLSLLLRPVDGESLERLQLLSVGIKTFSLREQNKKSLELKNKKITRLSGKQQFLIVSGDFFSEGHKLLEVEIKYFLRGQKKYFKPAVQDLKLEECFLSGSILAKDIQKFLELIGQENEFLFDDKLAKLNNRTAPVVPNQMLIVLLIFWALEGAAENDAMPKNFCLSFLSSLMMGQKFSCRRDAKHAAIFIDEEPAVLLEIQNS